MGKAEQKGSSLSISNFRVYSRNGTAIEDGESSCTNGPFWAYIWACGEWNTIKRLDFGTTPSQERQPRGRDQSFGRSFGLSWRGYEHKTTYSGWFSSSRPRCCANSNNTSTHHLQAHPQTLRTSGREWTRGRAHDKWKQLDNGISISLRTTNTEPSFRQS